MTRLTSFISAVLLLAPVVLRAETAVPPQAETKQARDARIVWWREARFGMFIHWGLYAIPGGTWKDKVHKEGYSEWIMFDEKIPAREYEKLAGKFNPVKFDARAWAGIARKAGMKYMVLTAKHHDGFSMFQSSLTPYNVADATPFKRDVTRELADACRDAGMHFGCYYSIDRDWYRPQGPGNRYKQNNVWDYPDSQRADFDRYFATFAKPQVEELLRKYRPDLLWFDEIDMKTDAQVEDLYRTIRKLRPECVINSRIQGCRFPAKIPPPHCDYITSGDNEILAKAPGFEWENPGSMNTSYGYNPNDHNWVSAAEIISRLVEIVSKGGNYLLNVGPTPEGLIPQPCIDRLAEVGAWMEVNGEAIYGTSASVFGDAAPPSAGNWRCTVKPGRIYLHLFKWPVDGKLEVPGLQSKVTKGYLLAGRKELKVEQSAGGVSLALPAEAPDKIASVICLEIAEPVARVGFVWPSAVPADCPFPRSQTLIGILFTGRHSDYRCGDTIYPSWASDGNLYTPWTDGETDGIKCTSGGSLLGKGFHTGHAVLIGDDPLKLTIKNTSPPKRAIAAPYRGRYPCGSLVHDGIWYYGTYCLGPSAEFGHEGFRWNWPNLGPMPGFQISRDLGKTWKPSPLSPEKPLFPEPGEFLGPVKMGAPHFVDFGKNMEHSPDGKAYLLGMGAELNDPVPRPCIEPGPRAGGFDVNEKCGESIHLKPRKEEAADKHLKDVYERAFKQVEGKAFAHGNLSWITADQVYLARVTPSPETINRLDAYEFFAGHDSAGKPLWTKDFAKIKPLLEWNNHMGCVTATYVPGLKKYLMCVTDGWPTVAKMNSYILEADQITGPWRMVAYMKDFGEQAYFLNFPSKFISEDGKALWLCYSANFSPGWNGVDLKFNPPGGRYGLSLHEIRLLDPKTYRVDPVAGDDANPPGKPWKTFGRLNAAKLAPGDTVLISPGVQEETLKPSGEGTAEDPVVIKFLPGVHTLGIKKVLRKQLFIPDYSPDRLASSKHTKMKSWRLQEW